MRMLHKGVPFGPWQILNVDLPIRHFRRASAAKDIGSRIGGLMQDPQHVVVLDWSPGEFSLMRSTADSPRREQVVLVKVANRCKCGASVLEAAEDLPNGCLHLEIGIKHNGVGFGVTQSDG